MDGPTRESAARSGDTTVGATEMGFNLVLLKRGDLRGISPPLSFSLPFQITLRRSFPVVADLLPRRKKSIPDRPRAQ